MWFAAFVFLCMLDFKLVKHVACAAAANDANNFMQQLILHADSQSLKCRISVQNKPHPHNSIPQNSKIFDGRDFIPQ